MRWAFGYRWCRTAVEFPGPQPRSVMYLGDDRGTWERRSHDGRVRSFSNFRYWVALQSFVVEAIGTLPDENNLGLMQVRMKVDFVDPAIELCTFLLPKL